VRGPLLEVVVSPMEWLQKAETCLVLVLLAQILLGDLLNPLEHPAALLLSLTLAYFNLDLSLNLEALVQEE